MSNARNGQDQTYRDPVRRLRFDDWPSIVMRNSPGATGVPAENMLSEGHSGRRLVVVAGAIALLTWGILYLVFREWRARYRERANYGTAQVVRALEPLSGVMPPGVELAAWRDAVDQTRAMLTTVTGSNLLTVADMDDLRVELSRHVRRAFAHPAVALDEVAEIWNEVADRGEFLLRDSRSITGDRHPRPRIIPSYGMTRVVPAIKPLLTIVPDGVDPGAWRDAVDQTRALLITVTGSNFLGVKAMDRLRVRLSEHVRSACDHPETGLVELAEVWNEATDEAPLLLKDSRLRDGERHPRPKILPPRVAKPSQVEAFMPVR